MSVRVSFPSSVGPALAGLIDEPVGKVRGWGVFAHGFTLGKDSPAASRVCRGLAAEGIGMLRFDNLGLGDSEGDWGDGSFTVKVADTVRAVDYMRANGRAADLLVGHSFGGAAAIVAACRSDGIRAVATIAAPFDPSRVERHYDALADRAVAEGSAQWLVGGRALTLKRQFVEDVRSAELGMHVRQLGVPLLVMHSPTDQTVGIRNAEQIFMAARHPRSFVAVEGADHLLLTRPHAARVAQVITGWVGPYMGAKAHRSPRSK